MFRSPLAATAPFKIGVQNLSENCPVSILYGDFYLKNLLKKLSGIFFPSKIYINWSANW